ncbi:MAG: hypothetical protein M0R22_07630 [Dehalococcoidia bacterium]|nr:hypothetical protein [Dehalococcoidia bacterium]
MNTKKGLREHVARVCRADTLLSRKPYTVMQVTYGYYKTIGVAKCSPKDQWNEQLGRTIAMGRAVAEIAAVLDRQGQRV